VVGLLADGLRWVIIAALDFLTPGPTRSPHSRTDPYAAELARQARAKYADAPHLLISVRATTTGATTAAARAAADDVTSGFGLLSAHGTRRRVRRPVAVARWRWVPERAMTLVGVSEAAVLAGLPAEPAAYGLPAAASRRRPASRDVFTTAPQGRTQTTGTPSASTPSASATGTTTTTATPPTVWSTP
jgi:hypothetical protein